MKTYTKYIEKISLIREPSNFKRAKIKSSMEAQEYVRNFFTSISIFESFFILLLNRGNNTIGYVMISQGGVTGTVVDVKIIAKYAIESLCSGLIMFHNHPSGEINPSQKDKEVTEKIKNGLNILDIHLLDHIIITENNYFSFADEGIL
ncbi:MAG: JAB domain-containing protein [Spirochaetales bacterium]|nr:JAB domain-containing protein [Spirochaetales bacterium]